ncbi:MAG TPA: PRC-barrel domain-containing protein [Balneolaceae bacterium]
MNTRIIAASDITGTKVKNLEKENIGEIQDLMTDVQTGDIIYAVLSFGGFMGMGDKYFAIPIEAMRFSEFASGNKEIMLDIDKEKLEHAPGFDKDNWPTEARSEFVTSMYKHYGYDVPERYHTRV